MMLLTMMALLGLLGGVVVVLLSKDEMLLRDADFCRVPKVP